MGETQTQLRPAASIEPPPLNRGLSIPPSSNPHLSILPTPLTLDTFSSPVNQNGCFEFDRVLKSGQVQKRTTKTKTWKSIFLVLRPKTLFIYKSEKENKLRHKIYLSDLTAVVFLKDPKQKRRNVFGLFSPSKNFHLQTSNAHDCQEWVDLIRKEARIEEEEEEMFLASPTIRRQSEMDSFFPNSLGLESHKLLVDREAMMLSSSPEPADLLPTPFASPLRTPSQGLVDSGGWSGGEVASHSDFSDNDMPHPPPSTIDRFAVRPPPPKSAGPAAASASTTAKAAQPAAGRPSMTLRGESQGGLLLDDPDRVVWQGRLYLMRSKGGVRQWKNCWAVLRPRNLILYKDESEYAALFIIPLFSIINVVDLDPISRTKKFCLQIITEEKSYRFATREEESLLQCLGAFKSLLARRKELEAKAVAAATAAAGSEGGRVAVPAALAAKG